MQEFARVPAHHYFMQSYFPAAIQWPDPKSPNHSLRQCKAIGVCARLYCVSDLAMLREPRARIPKQPRPAVALRGHSNFEKGRMAGLEWHQMHEDHRKETDDETGKDNAKKM